MDIKKLEKLVRLAGSDNDHEALLALRQAQKITKGDLWGALRSDHRAPFAYDERKIHALETQLRAKDAEIRSLRKDLAALEDKLRAKKTHKGGFDLSPHFDRPGYYEIYYELSLEEWIKAHRIRPSVYSGDWSSVADLKSEFERTIKRGKLEVSTKRFSQLLAKALGVKPVKGGPAKDLMGFLIRISY